MTNKIPHKGLLETKKKIWTQQKANENAVTGKKARYVELQEGQSMTAGDKHKTKEVNGLFAFMHAIDARFFNGEITDDTNARILKAKGARARGAQGADTELTTVEQYFRIAEAGDANLTSNL